MARIVCCCCCCWFCVPFSPFNNKLQPARSNPEFDHFRWSSRRVQCSPSFPHSQSPSTNWHRNAQNVYLLKIFSLVQFHVPHSASHHHHIYPEPCASSALSPMPSTCRPTTSFTEIPVLRSNRQDDTEMWWPDGKLTGTFCNAFPHITLASLCGRF